MEFNRLGTSPGGDQNPSAGFPSMGGPPPYCNNAGPPPPPGIMPNICPTAPSLNDAQRLQGYENVTYEQEIMQPPSAPDWLNQAPIRKDITNLSPLTEEQVNDALLQYISEHCCYGKGFAKEMIVEQIRMSSVFHYTLETYTEKRESAWRFQPYTDQAIDGPMNGTAPGPWDVPVYPSSLFVDGVTKVEVPHTAIVKPCHECVGNGRIRCAQCNGNGHNRCTWCHGTGHRNGEGCSSCHNTGHKRCFHCNATGQIKCKTCNGKGNLKNFVQLTVTWTNHYDDYISDVSNLPKEEVRKVSGDVVFEEENPQVWPIARSGDQKVDLASQDLVQKHSKQFTAERILKQRHCLRIIPINEVNYQWKNKSGQFYVSGFENKVFFQKYPQNCCCCCTII